jgi:hypothetical protein
MLTAKVIQEKLPPIPTKMFIDCWSGALNLFGAFDAYKFGFVLNSNFLVGCVALLIGWLYFEFQTQDPR